MKIDKTQLVRILREETDPAVAHRIQRRICEAEFYDETPEGQLKDIGDDDLRFNLQAQVENDVKSTIVKAVKEGLDVETTIDAVLRTADSYQGY